MNPGDFHRHLGRLTEQFGKSAYSQARAELIWREVKDLSACWWEKTVDKFLLSCRQAPLMDEISNEIGAERERIWKLEKKRELKAPWSNNPTCLECGDVGTLPRHDESGIIYAYRCYCPIGQKRTENYPIWGAA